MLALFLSGLGSLPVPTKEKHALLRQQYLLLFYYYYCYYTAEWYFTHVPCNSRTYYQDPE